MPGITKARIAENCILELQKLPTSEPIDVYFIDDKAAYMCGACVGAVVAKEAFPDGTARPSVQL